MKTAVVVCPGRGTYNKTELGYLGRFHPEKAALFRQFDARRAALGQQTLASLDGSKTYSARLHASGENASALIYAATFADFLCIDREQIEILAVTGNSMGWYSALACAGAVSPDGGFEIANTMGALMQRHMIGGQLIYPFVDEEWRDAPENKRKLLALVAEINDQSGHQLALSIDLGGMLVVAGNPLGLSAFEAAAPPLQGRFPLRLANHAAFHTSLQAPVAAAGRAALAPELFRPPETPLIDGRGAIWWPGGVEVDALWDYTLGHQVTETYDFSRAIRVAALEFAPDLFVIAGPGTTMGGAVAQSLILCGWRGMRSRADFRDRQASEGVLVSMGMEDQRSAVLLAPGQESNPR